MKRRPRIIAVVYTAMALLMFVTPKVAAQTTLVVGVRNDAPPFSALSSPDTDTYSGYVVDICKAVLKEMRSSQSFQVTFRPVEPSTRFKDLSSGEIDVLCDPSTIDQERLTLPNVMVSQPIYMSGIGVAAAKRFDEWVAHWPCVGPIVGVVEGTTTRSDVIGKLAKDRRFGVSFGEKVMQHPNVDHDSLTAIEADQFTRCAAKAKQDNIDASRLATAERPSPVLKSFLNHSSLARAVCEQQVMFSVGDLEIIAQALKAAQADNPDCAFEIDPVVISEERYGIFVNVSPQMDARDKLAVEFLRQLSVEIHKGHESILIRSFRNNFDAANVSRTLNIFFWNVIAGSK